MNMSPARLCACGKPILAASKSGKCLECRQSSGGASRPTSATVRLVYVIGGTAGPVKIGVSSKPHDRLAQLCATSDTTKMPAGIDRSALRILYAVEGDRALEQHLQRRFRQHQVLGEWFDLGPPETAWRRVEAEVKMCPVVGELDLNLDSLNNSEHVADLVRELYVAVLDQATRVALRKLFPGVLSGQFPAAEVA